MTGVEHLPEPDVRWPVMVVVTNEVLLWEPGADSADAARRMNQRDPTIVLEKAERADTTGGGVHAAVPAAWDEVYIDDYVGPRLPDGSFWGPGARAAWTPTLTRPAVTS